MSDFYEGAEYAESQGFLTSTDAFNAVCTELANLQAQRDALLADLDAAREALRDAENSMNVVRDNLIEDRHHWPEGMLEHAGDLEAAAAAARAALARLEGKP